MLAVKKIASIVDNHTKSEQKRRELITTIQKLRANNSSITEIAEATGKNWKTVKKYLDGDVDILCRSNVKSSLEGQTDFIIKCITSGMTQSSIAKALAQNGYQGSETNARLFVCSIAKKNGLELSKYGRHKRQETSNDGKKQKVDFITRKGIFNYLWMNGELTKSHHDFLWNKYPVLQNLENIVREFRGIYEKGNMPFLYLFIEKYKASSIKDLASFANGLENDIEAVENSVASPLSNGFVEGTNSKVKMIKRTMYGRCSKGLLAAKLMYNPQPRVT